MKRVLIIFSFLAVFTIFSYAYDLGAESQDRYTVFDPDKRAMGMTYPLSWLTPGEFLFVRHYDDSSYTYAQWSQQLTPDQIVGGYFNVSNNIVVKYIPYSYPQRWSAGLEFIQYQGSNPTQRTDAVLHYRNNKGEVQYYHTNNTQTLRMNAATTVHKIRSHALDFNYQAAKKIKVFGGIDLSRIEQNDNSIRHYDTFHGQGEFRYIFSRPFHVYGKFEYRYFLIHDRESIMMVFRPGLRYQKGIFMTHLAVRIAPEKMFPVAQFILRPQPFYFEAYAKVRNPLFILKQPGYQYIGIKTGLHYEGEHHAIQADVDASYDHTGVAPGTDTSPVYLPPNFYSLKAQCEYRFRIPAFEMYTRASYFQTFRHVTSYYHPEIAAFTGGLLFHARPVEGKLLLDLDLSAQYILHDDPENVSFDPSTLTYSLAIPADPVGDWKVNLNLRARVRTFSILLEASVPLKAGEDLAWYLYEGIYTSSDFRSGNTFYAGLKIEWYWWK